MGSWGRAESLRHRAALLMPIESRLTTSAQIFVEHDHGACSEYAMEAAHKLCSTRGLRLTPVREKVLELLLESHGALGADTILEKLVGAGFRSQPPVAYRALDFLVEHGLVHRIEKLNAFVACNKPQPGHAPAFMICKDCHQVAETHGKSTSGTLGKAARAIGFDIQETVVEAEGICAACREV